MPIERAITTMRPTRANDPIRISPRAKRGRSSLTHVITSPGFREGVGTGIRVGRAEATAGEGLRLSVAAGVGAA